ncbi:hypothetical protein [Mycobacteroides abscessus]|uniref:hypothetical protein n=1 Tax=Mycobacteroides abscessus TaxID=36809 RepID=UPI0019D1D379|nr:hypothetical protein [Mycobacteroides abscessus]MBN7457553.1 hypothetical protein [Mycobacteroides abscessus subsp. abscessus]
MTEEPYVEEEATPEFRRPRAWHVLTVAALVLGVVVPSDADAIWMMLTIVVWIAALVVGFRRLTVYLTHKRDVVMLASFARRFPPEHLALAPHDELEKAAAAGHRAAAEAMSQRVHLFGGDPAEDERRAYAFRDLAQQTSREKQRRLAGGWLPDGSGAGGLDGMEPPQLPPTETPTEAPAQDWRSKLTSGSEDW